MAEEELDVRVGRTRTGVSRVDDGVGSVIRPANTPLTNLLKRYEEITNNSEGSNEEVHSSELTKVLEEMDAANAWDAERRVKETLKKFGLGQEFFQKTGEVIDRREETVGVSRGVD